MAVVVQNRPTCTLGDRGDEQVEVRNLSVATSANELAPDVGGTVPVVRRAPGTRKTRELHAHQVELARSPRAPEELELDGIRRREPPGGEQRLELSTDTWIAVPIRPCTRVGELHYVVSSSSSSSARSISSLSMSNTWSRNYSRSFRFTISSSARWTVSVVPFVPSTSRAWATKSRSRFSDVRLTMAPQYAWRSAFEAYALTGPVCLGHGVVLADEHAARLRALVAGD